MDQQPNTQAPAPKRRAEFQNLMSLREKIAGWIYLPIHTVGLPLFLGVIIYTLTGGRIPDDVTINAIYYLIGLVFLLALQFRFFHDSYMVFTRNFRKALTTLLLGYAILLGLNVILNLVVGLFGTLPTSPNDEAVTELAHQDLRRIAASAVIMAPIVEEALFRGMIFGSLRPKSRVAAYAVSMILFSLYHVWQYAVYAHSFTVLLSAVAYLPIAFVLAFCYDRSGSIWTPIFFHMFYNALALSAQ